MTRPSPLVLVALLLGAAYIAADTPRLRAGAVIAAVALLLVLVGWATYRRMPRLSRLPRLIAPVLLAAGGLLAAVAWGSLAAANPTLRYTYLPNVRPAPPAVVTTRGFYRTETDPGMGDRYAWTQGRATLVLDSLVRRPVTLSVEMRSAALAGGADIPVLVEVNGERVGELRPDPRNPAFQSLSLRFTPTDWGGEQTEVRLLTPAFVPVGGGDPRQLGTMVRAITVDNTEAWSGFERRRWLLWLVPVLAALAVALAAGARRTPARARMFRLIGAAVCAAGGGVAAVVAALLWRVGTLVPNWHALWVLAATVLAAAFAAAAAGFLLTPPVRAFAARFARTVAARAARSVAIQRAATVRATEQQETATRGAGLRGDLAAVFLVAFSVRVLWALITPPWLAPDEPDHYTYTAHIVEQGRLPYPALTRFPSYPNEFGASANLSLVPKLSPSFSGTLEPELPFLPPIHDYAPARDYRGAPADRLSADGARATPYPPLYYLLVAPFYGVAQDTPVITRLFAVRLGSAVFGALAPVFGYLLAWEMRRSRRWGLALGLCMGLMPMFAFTTASANNDAVLFPLCAALCWLLARLWRQVVPAPRLLLAMGATMGLVVVTKPTGYGVLITVAALALLWMLVRVGAERGEWRAHAVSAAAGLLGLLVVTGPWLAFRRLVVDVPKPRPTAEGAAGAEGAVAWVQGMLGAMVVHAADPAPVTAAAAAAVAAVQSPPQRMYSLAEYFAMLAQKSPEHWHWLLVRSFWGVFGWLDEPMPAPAYAAITIFIAIGLIGAGGILLFQPRNRPGVLLALALVVGQIGFLFIGADYYEGFRRSGFELGLQGRYFFPIFAPYLLLLLSGWHYLLGERRVALRLAPVAMLAVLLVAFGTMLATYYGVTFG